MATEQTPLLAECSNNAESVTPSNQAGAPGGVDIKEEPTNRELALTMSCIWVCIPPSSVFNIF
jgi:hypothetical protein